MDTKAKFKITGVVFLIAAFFLLVAALAEKKD